MGETTYGKYFEVEMKLIQILQEAGNRDSTVDADVVTNLEGIMNVLHNVLGQQNASSGWEAQLLWLLSSDVYTRASELIRTYKNRPRDDDRSHIETVVQSQVLTWIERSQSFRS